MAHKGEANLLTTLSDSMLLQRAAGGDTASFATLFYRHYDRVYGLLFRLVGNRDEAEDLTQEVFVKLHLQRFPAAEEHNVSAWLYRVATNAALMRYRKRLRQMGASYAELAEICDVAPGSVGTLLRRAAVAFRRAYEERER